MDQLKAEAQLVSSNGNFEDTFDDKSEESFFVQFDDMFDEISKGSYLLPEIGMSL